MAYDSGYVTNAYELIAKIDAAVTANNWKAVYQRMNSANKLDLAVWEGIGDGNDKIYVEMRVLDNERIVIDGLAGYDRYLDYYEQPGSIQQSLKATIDDTVDQPMLHTTGNELFYYWT